VLAHSILPIIDSSRIFEELKRLWSHVWRMDRDIDKRKTAFTTRPTIDYTSKAPKIVNFGSQTIKFCCLIPNHPSLTLRLLYMYMIMQLRWGHVTAAKEIATLQLSPNRTYGAGRPHVGFCPIFLVLFYCTLYTDFPRSSTDAVSRHVSFA